MERFKLRPKPTLFIWVLLTHDLPLQAATQSDHPYAKSYRVQHIHNTLQAVMTTDPVTLDNAFNYIHIMDRNACQSATASLKINCLLSAAEKACHDIRNSKRREQCLLYTDTIVANKLGETNFVSDRERFAMLKKSTVKNPRGYGDLLKQNYAVLATDFLLSVGNECAPNNLGVCSQQLDAFCMRTSDRNHLGWQHCVSAIVWFLGTTRDM